MIKLERGMIVDIDLNPTKGSETGKVRPCVIVTNNQYNSKVPVIQVVPMTEWNEKKGAILTNVSIEASVENGLTKKSIADCLQTRPVDYRERLVYVRGKLEHELLIKIDLALKFVFAL